jgi:hypothetical protein
MKISGASSPLDFRTFASQIPQIKQKAGKNIIQYPAAGSSILLLFYLCTTSIALSMVARTKSLSFDAASIIPWDSIPLSLTVSDLQPLQRTFLLYPGERSAWQPRNHLPYLVSDFQLEL